MNKSELAERLVGRTGINKAVAKDAVDTVFEAVSEALANGEEVRIVGFGTFGARHRPARTGRKPADGRESCDSGLDRAGVQAEQGAQGWP